MLGAYFDASGTHGGSPSVSIAGLVAEAPRWKTFEGKWRDMLVKAGSLDKKGRPVFHMTDFANNEFPYKNWGEKKKAFVFKKLANAMAGRVKMLVASAVTIDEYREVQKELAAYKGIRPFTFCFTQCLLKIADIMHQLREDEPIAYFFESGDQCGGELDRLKRYIEKRQNLRAMFRWKSFTTAAKIDVGALQGADIWAYENQKEMLNFIVPRQALKPLRKSFRALINAFVAKKVLMSGGYVDRDTLVSIAPSYAKLNLWS